MKKFHTLYRSFADFFETFSRGNEVEFVYRGKHFSLFPSYDEKNSVTAVMFYSVDEDLEKLFLTAEQLYNCKIGDEKLGDIVSEIEITWNNI